MLGGKFSENDYLLQQTTSFIALYGRDIQLVRGAVWEDDGAGGVIRPDDEPLQPVPLQRLFFGSYDDAERFIQTPPSGVQRTNMYVLVGLPNANIQAGDTFKIGTDEYKVEWIDTELTFQKLAEVIWLGIREEDA